MIPKQKAEQILESISNTDEAGEDTVEAVRFDETVRIRELISQQRARREQAVTGNGHGLAMAAVVLVGIHRGSPRSVAPGAR